MKNFNVLFQNSKNDTIETKLYLHEESIQKAYGKLVKSYPSAIRIRIFLDQQ